MSKTSRLAAAWLLTAAWGAVGATAAENAGAAPGRHSSDAGTSLRELQEEFLRQF